MASHETRTLEDPEDYVDTKRILSTCSLREKNSSRILQMYDKECTVICNVGFFG